MSSYLPPEPESARPSREAEVWGSPDPIPPTMPLPQGANDGRGVVPVFDSPAQYGPGAYGTPPATPYAQHPRQLSHPGQPGYPSQTPYAGYAPPAGYPLAPTYAAQPGYLVTPGYMAAIDPGAPFGRDPFTREPLSDKSKVSAGLLQLFLGSLGIGRFYIGHSGVGAAQLILTIVGYATMFFGVGVILIFGVALWAFVDAIMMLTGSVRDSRGLKLRS